MTTLVAVYNSDGCIGRCDARCYEAKNAKCHCICGGRNHSAGKQRARENVAERVGLEPEDIARFMQGRERKYLEPLPVVIDRTQITNARAARREAYMRINQLSLFDRTPISWWECA